MMATCRIHKKHRPLSCLYLTTSGEHECNVGTLCNLPVRLGPAAPVQLPTPVQQVVVKVEPRATSFESPGVQPGPGVLSSASAASCAAWRAVRSSELMSAWFAAGSSKRPRWSNRSSSREVTELGDRPVAPWHKSDQGSKEDVSVQVVDEDCSSKGVELLQGQETPVLPSSPEVQVYHVTLYSKAESKKAAGFISSLGDVCQLEVDSLWNRTALGAWKHCGRHSKIRDVCRQSPHFESLQKSAVAFLENGKVNGIPNPGVGLICRDGIHMSVAAAEELAGTLQGLGFHVSIFHLSMQHWRPACRDGICEQCTVKRQGA